MKADNENPLLGAELKGLGLLLYHWSETKLCSSPPPSPQLLSPLPTAAPLFHLLPLPLSTPAAPTTILHFPNPVYRTQLPSPNPVYWAPLPYSLILSSPLPNSRTLLSRVMSSPPLLSYTEQWTPPPHLRILSSPPILPSIKLPSSTPVYCTPPPLLPYTEQPSPTPVHFTSHPISPILNSPCRTPDYLAPLPCSHVLELPSPTPI